MLEPKVTVVVIPQERFSYTKFSLEKIYRYTGIPFKLIYIDNNSPQPIKRYLVEQSQAKGFHLIRTEKYLSPNQSRNLALANVDTEYVVFIDNDVQVTPGWLRKLVKCAEETNAWVVGPLLLDSVYGKLILNSVQGKLKKQNIHIAGGYCRFQEKNGKTDLYEQRRFAKNSVPTVSSNLQRETTELIEFHCFLVRTAIFKQIGYFDEKLMSIAEESDFCLTVRNAGGTIYFEPDSVVIYVLPAWLQWYDLPYFLLRWSDSWNKASLNYFQQKWSLSEDSQFISLGYKWANRHRLVPLQSIPDIMLKILPWQKTRISDLPVFSRFYRKFFNSNFCEE
ncbi:glycosyltransferase [Nostoc sp. FACHB-152]|uniref:glycosyltransferase family 2 protein n=1 Tax=unclassified Nostoc TaxID=2593658 RepID=UPI00168A3C42|nr:MULTISPECIES: glycosyltransferase [unclassified Nostoc]MBD2451997.1 glycosyltransferase [Nostoc sp. FACHB-152]MBD2471197.1 glycosyltransferase [Nostoc sp. FACHB-145]